MGMCMGKLCLDHAHLCDCGVDIYDKIPLSKCDTYIGQPCDVMNAYPVHF